MINIRKEIRSILLEVLQDDIFSKIMNDRDKNFKEFKKLTMLDGQTAEIKFNNLIEIMKNTPETLKYLNSNNKGIFNSFFDFLDKKYQTNLFDTYRV